MAGNRKRCDGSPGICGGYKSLPCPGLTAEMVDRTREAIKRFLSYIRDHPSGRKCAT